MTPEPVERHRTSAGSAQVEEVIEERPIEAAIADQTRSASSPATTKPPSSIDQSPVSNPRSRPSFVSRKVVANRNMGEPYDLLTA